MKKTAIIAGLILAGVVCVSFYSSVHLTYQAQNLGPDSEAKLLDLRTAGKRFPWNDTSFEETGSMLLSRAVSGIGDVPTAEADVLEAYANLRRALRLNPGSAAAHFYYAKTLDLMKYLGPVPEGESAFAEYEKAARLAGPNHALIRDIGIILLGQWDSLSEAAREFTLSLLHRTLLPGDMMRFQEVLHIWDMNIRDDAVMQRIAPDSPVLLRMYAQFLAEKGLSLAARQSTLARVERLEYELAWKENEIGENPAKAGSPSQAAEHLAACLAALKRIKFYGLLIGDQKIGAEVEKKMALLKSASRALAKARLDETRSLVQAEEPLREYLALETDFNQVTELETYLKDLRIIPDNESDLPIKDTRQLALNVLLMFKLHMYRQIVSLGSQLQRSLLPTGPAVNKDLAEIFQMVGDSYFKLDFVYEPEVFYQKALELSPGNPEVLFRMKKYYERRNDTEKLAEVDRVLASVLSTGDLLAKPRLILKGATFDQSLLMNVNQKRIRLELEFQSLPENPRPLVSIFLNDRVYWENYLEEQAVRVELGVKEGFNRLQIAAVNGPVALVKLNITPLQ